MDQFLADFSLLEKKINETENEAVKKILEKQLKAMSYDS